jgi:hypothetical protein
MPHKKTSRLGHIPEPPDADRLVEQFVREAKKLPPEGYADTDRRIEEAFEGGFNDRDEANALIAMAVRNGPIEDLHAGRSSTLLEDDTLSRITDEEIKILMINMTKMLMGLLRFRDKHPELYRRWIRHYGMMYCRRWNREV